MKKRLLSLFLALCMLMTVLPMTAMATDGGEEVNADAIFEMQDFNLLSEDRGNGYNVGWKYAEGFQTDTITALEVGLKDPNGELIIKYTASDDQLTYQRDNGYIAQQSSAPIYKDIAEIEDADWTVVWGEDDIHAKWNVSSAYVTVTTAEGSYTLENTECKHTHTYTEEVASDLTYKGLEENGEKAYYKTYNHRN